MSSEPALPSDDSPPRDPSEDVSSYPSHSDKESGGRYLRLHGASLVFDLIAHGKSYLLPAVFGLWGAAKGNYTLLVFSAVIFVPAFLTSVFRYFTYRYRIEKDHLVVKQGLIFRNVRTVPVSRIQNIDFVQNLFHRMLNVAEVKIETASGTKPEATMRVLSMAEMENLRNAVFSKQAEQEQKAAENQSASLPRTDRESVFDSFGETTGIPVDPTSTAPITVDRPQPSEAVTLLEIPTAWLVKAGLASNRGMALVAVVLGGYFQFGGSNTLVVDYLKTLAKGFASVPIMIMMAITGIIVLLLLLRVLGIGWFVLRFHGYRLVRQGEDLRISCGLLTKVSATVPRARIQFISIHQNLIMRMMGFSSIRIETAGGAGANSESATESVSKRWFVPVLPSELVAGLLAELRPGFVWDEESLDFQPLAARAGRRLCRLAIVETLIMLGVGLAISLVWGWILGVVTLPLAWMWAIKKSKAMRYARTENGVVYRSGVLTRKVSITFFEKIQTLRVNQSPFDRRWKMAKLCVDTAAAGPADHKINVPYLDEQFAFSELQTLRKKTGQQQPVFG